MRRKSRRQKALLAVILIIALCFFLFPVVWMFLTSFKTPWEYFASPPVFIPEDFALTNYFNVMRPLPAGGGGMGALGDSLIVSLATMTASVVIGASAAYGFARFQTGGRNLSFWVLSIRMFPPIASALPLFLIFREFRLLDTHMVLIIANTIFNLPFVIWILKGFFEDLPVELEEAALIDGCSRFGAFFRVALPLITPGIVAAALFAFVFSWNEFMFALLFTRREVYMVTVMVSTLVGGHEILWGEIAAMGMIAIIPAIVLVLCLQRFLLRGLTLGAVKG